MKRVLFAITGILLLVSSIGVSGVPVSAAANNFTIDNYDADYYLGKNSEGRSTLKTVEKITATFPTSNQNHGLERAIPQSYDGHPTHVKISSIVDENGTGLEYGTSSSNDYLIVRVGNADTYVHGVKTYVITYEQQDVTRYFADTASDEFYWDINGTEWGVPIKNFAVRLHVDDALTSNLKSTTDVACYIGKSGSTNDCELIQSDGVFTATSTYLAPGENVTIAIGFKPQTFAAYQQSFLDKLTAFYWITVYLSIPIAIILLIILSVRFYGWSNRGKDVGTVVPEYLPPRDFSVTVAGSILKINTKTFTAQLIDLAVRHYLKIYETKPKSFLVNAKYDIEIVKDPRDLLMEEWEILKDIFSNEPYVGKRLALDSLKNNTSVGLAISDNPGKVQSLITTSYGLRAKDAQKSRWFRNAGFVLLGISVLTLNIPFFIVAVTTFILGVTLSPLTDKGLALKRYLLGLKHYISVAETERLKMLQSPDGAAKVGGTADDSGKLVKLYERVLPYAILFGQEREWNLQIGAYYEAANTQPSWYSGTNGAFNAIAFSAAMSSFSTTSSYTSASSSSSGGSSGGGFSGGGGGGGGGGGW